MSTTSIPALQIITITWNTAASMHSTPTMSTRIGPPGIVALKTMVPTMVFPKSPSAASPRIQSLKLSPMVMHSWMNGVPAPATPTSVRRDLRVSWPGLASA
ncbi:MAG: hypothetical protein M3Z49_00575, partial [Bifidobacteriales bacterium]|nr:hypothetical protein [Bifidobacteriales bacterium]